MIAYVTWFTEQGRQIADKISGMPLHITYGQCCESYGGRIGREKGAQCTNGFRRHLQRGFL